jgi:hypothetical protein
MIEMMNRYIKDDDVYEMGNGIYGKVLDGVWQYIRNSPDKADLCKILRSELKDSIGMCLAGNLTRICNVVAIVTHGKLRAFGSVDEVMSKLCPQRNYEVQLATSEAMEQGEKTLRGMLTDTEPISASPAELTLRFPTVRSEAELSEVLYRLVGAKVPVVQFREVTSDLEDAFLSVAGKD